MKKIRKRINVIEQVIKTSEGDIRVAQVRTFEENKKPEILSRPVQKIYPLGLNEDEQRSTYY